MRIRRLAILLATVGLSVTAAGAHAAPYREARVRVAVEEAGFEPIAVRAAKASRPTVIVGRKREPAPARLGTSRFGDSPDLPAGRPWPQCGGKPQSFLGQVRLGDIPRGTGRLRRHGGLLLFFTHVEFETPSDTSYGMWAGDCTTVVHARRGDVLRRTPAPRRTMRLRPARMRFRAAPDLPDTALDGNRLNVPLRDVEMDPAEQERWWGLVRGLHGEPKLEHRMLGYVGTPNGGDGCFSRTQRTSGAWRHLFTMGPDLGLRFEVADAGRLQIAISRSDLRRGRFDRACGIFDSA